MRSVSRNHNFAGIDTGHDLGKIADLGRIGAADLQDRVVDDFQAHRVADRDAQRLAQRQRVACNIDVFVICACAAASFGLGIAHINSMHVTGHVRYHHVVFDDKRVGCLTEGAKLYQVPVTKARRVHASSRRL